MQLKFFGTFHHVPLQDERKTFFNFRKKHSVVSIIAFHACIINAKPSQPQQFDGINAMYLLKSFGSHPGECQK